MQNRYVGDLGDFGKFGLLRGLFGCEIDGHPSLKLGIVTGGETRKMVSRRPFVARAKS